MFFVVKFIEERGHPLDGVPASWVKRGSDGTKLCAWPTSLAKTTIRSLIECEAKPGETWTSCKCKVIAKKDTYSEIMEELQRRMKLPEHLDGNVSEIEESANMNKSEKASCSHDPRVSPPAKQSNQVLKQKTTNPINVNENSLLDEDHSPELFKEPKSHFQAHKEKTTSSDSCQYCFETLQLVKSLVDQVTDLKQEVKLNRKVISKEMRKTIETTQNIAEPASQLPSLPIENNIQLMELEDVLKNEAQKQLLVSGN